MTKPLTVTVLCLVLFFSLTESALSQEPLVLGIHPYSAASALHNKFTPLTEYLSRELGKKIIIRIAQSYDKHVENIGQDKVDIAYIGPNPYIKLVSQYGRKRILAGLEVRGQRTFHGVIITRENSNHKTLQDLKGEKIAFVDSSSTMGYLVPLYMLLEEGIGIEQLASYEFLKNHDNVALGVLMGDFDAGAVKEGVFNKYRARGIRALATTPELATHIFVASAKVPEATVTRLQQAMYKLGKSEAGRKILIAIKSDVTGLVPAADDQYNTHRMISDNLRAHGLIP